MIKGRPNFNHGHPFKQRHLSKMMLCLQMKSIKHLKYLLLCWLVLGWTCQLGWTFECHTKKFIGLKWMWEQWLGGNAFLWLMQLPLQTKGGNLSPHNLEVTLIILNMGGKCLYMYILPNFQSILLILGALDNFILIMWVIVYIGAHYVNRISIGLSNNLSWIRICLIIVGSNKIWFNWQNWSSINKASYVG